MYICMVVQFLRMQFYLCVFRLTPVEKLGTEVRWPEEEEYGEGARGVSGDVLAIPDYDFRLLSVGTIFSFVRW